MKPRRLKVFFYGLFMDEELLRSKGADPSDVKLAGLPGYELRIGQRATLVANAASSAHGVVMDLTHKDIELLYSDPSVSMYKPEGALIQFADGSYAASLCFTLAEPPRPEEKNPEYARKLRELALRLCLPANYIECIH